MTFHTALAASDAAALPRVLVDAARCWRAARAEGREAQPSLSRTLDVEDVARDWTVLAPVLDSLYCFFESALGRPMAVGEAASLSDDESLLLGLVGGSCLRACLDCPAAAATALDCALCSTRIMLTLTLSDRPGGTLQ